MSINNELENLYFHDSTLRGINVSFSDGNARSCVLDIDYYNWEGNQKVRESLPNEPWKWRRLILKFGYLAHIEFSAPDLMNRAQDLDDAELGYAISTFEDEYKKFKLEFPRGKSPLFENGEVISIRFTTQNYSSSDSGYLWVVGNDVSITWEDADTLVGQIHIPIQNA